MTTDATGHVLLKFNAREGGLGNCKGPGDSVGGNARARYRLTLMRSGPGNRRD